MLLLGYGIVYKEYNLTRFNHQKKLLKWVVLKIMGHFGYKLHVIFRHLIFRGPKMGP